MINFSQLTSFCTRFLLVSKIQSYPEQGYNIIPNVGFVSHNMKATYLPEVECKRTHLSGSGLITYNSHQHLSVTVHLSTWFYNMYLSKDSC